MKGISRERGLNNIFNSGTKPWLESKLMWESYKREEKEAKYLLKQSPLMCLDLQSSVTKAVLLETQINGLPGTIESHLLLYSAPNIPFTQIYHNTEMQLRRLMYCSTEPESSQASAG